MTAGQSLPGKTGQRRFPVSKIRDFLKHCVFGHQASGKFLSRLKSEIKNSPEVDTDALIQDIKKEAKQIEGSIASSIEDSPSNGHLELCSIVLVKYDMRPDE